MPKILPERRDQTVLNHLIDIKTGLAENTVETRLLKEAVTTLNGKVAGHETRLQSLESDKAVNKVRFESEDKQDNYRTQLYRRWTDRIIWGVFVFFILFIAAIAVRVGLIDRELLDLIK